MNPVLRRLPTIALLLPLHFLLLAKSSSADSGIEHLDPTLPPALPGKAPDCSVLVIQQDFAGGSVPSPTPAPAAYTQPEACPAPWTSVVLDLSVSASNVHRNRIGAVWIDGAEILRTSTPLSTAPGAFWRVQKDVTRYSALLHRLGGGGVVIYMVLENSDAALPGAYSANVSLHFYRGWVSEQTATFPARAKYTAHPTVKGLYREPADLIIPVSPVNGGSGFWFQINNRFHVPTASVVIPRNTYRAVLEVFASYHAADEFWYANPLRSSYDDDLRRGEKANGGFRQLYATLDGRFIGGHIPLPIIYPGSINPYFWSPVAAIGAFDLPSYHLDVTPFLSLLLDGRPHEIGLGVKHSQPYWLLTGNLHVWVDEWSNAVEAGLVEYKAPAPTMSRHAEWLNQDGSSEVGAAGLVRFKGWVSSSQGNLTTEVRQKVTFKSQVAVQNRGAVRQVEMVNKERTSVVVHQGNEVVGRVRLFVEAPLQVQASGVRAACGAVFQRTRLSHQLLETVIVNENRAVSTIELADRQDAEGAAMMRDGAPVWGSGSTRSSYKYTDQSTCYLRAVNTEAGMIKSDITSPSCATAADA